jgi:hypothetical protein
VIFVASFGLSEHHGSELAVGWEWFERTRLLGNVRFISHSAFDSRDYLSVDDARRVVFLGQKPLREDDVNTKHIRYAYRFWRDVRAYVKQHGKASDVLVVVSPSAAWFMPFITGLPMSRAQVFCGPMGVDQVDLAKCRGGLLKTRMALRNFLVKALALSWRILATQLPMNLSFRFKSEWFERALGSHYRVVATLPELEMTSGVPAPSRSPGAMDRTMRRELLLVSDERPRKNFEATVAFALDYAARHKMRIVALGVESRGRQNIAAKSAAAGVEIAFRPKMDRTAFRGYLAEARPVVVSLSVSEGVPSLLIEALVSGCEICVFPVGGIAWLAQLAETSKLAQAGSPDVLSLRWGAGTYDAYRRLVSQLFAKLLGEIRSCDKDRLDEKGIA